VRVEAIEAVSDATRLMARVVSNHHLSRVKRSGRRPSDSDETLEEPGSESLSVSLLAHHAIANGTNE
jgi:hypothetical protein